MALLSTPNKLILRRNPTSQVIQRKPATRLLVEKGIFPKKEFMDMVKTVDRERKRASK